ncbi:response regulator [Pseudoalteromonas sp. SSM20]|uniref:response regulator n=1 Tax=Pseudoalteromonas sp. SSM20 TaxID=3139394 RepID=UPI003BAC6897
MEKLNQVKVLLVEDDEDDYLLTVDYLEQIPNYQFDVTWLCDYQSVLDLLAKKHFDLCFLDYQLGTHTGLSILKVAKSLKLSTTFMMLTGQSDENLDAQALAFGADDFLLKSEINSPRFVRAILYALSRRDLESERLERFKAEAESRAKDRFMAHLSHELRTPLTSIIGYTQLLRENQQHSTIKPELDIIHNNSEHLLNLLNDVLDLSKINASSLSLEKENTALGPLIADLQSVFSMEAAKKGIALNIITKGDLPKTINTDAKRLKQILINLVYNAIKFTPKGKVDVVFELLKQNTQYHLKVSVIDTGIGIANDKLTQIFKPFEQIQDTITRTKEGAGLGLAISAALVKLFGGEINVQSQLGEGSTFSFSIHLGEHIDTCQPLDLALNQKTQTPTLAPTLSGNVLIVEDLPEIQTLLNNIISSTGACVTCANNGREAVDLLSSQQQQFDIVFMDLHMPEMGGKEAIIALRERNIHSPIIALTAAAQKDNIDTLLALGFDDIITKPINTELLYQSLQKHLENTPSKTSNAATSNFANRSEKCILVVEDDKNARDLMCLLLQSLDCEVLGVGSYGECVELLKHDSQFDTICLDLNLSDGSGLSLASIIREHNCDANLVIVSGSEPPAEQLAEHQIEHVILKPVSLNDLKNVI